MFLNVVKGLNIHVHIATGKGHPEHTHPAHSTYNTPTQHTLSHTPTHSLVDRTVDLLLW